MKKIAMILLASISVSAHAADVAISALPAASSLDGTEVFPIVQSATTKKSTIDLISGLISGDVTCTNFACTVDTVNGGETVLGAGTLTNGNLCKYNSTGPVMDCNTPAPTGTIVGTSDSQTLSAKTLTLPTLTGTTWSSRGTATAGLCQRITDVGATAYGSMMCADGARWLPANGSAPICSVDAQSSTTSTSAVKLGGCTLPAALLANTDRLRIFMTATKANTSNNCTFDIRLGTADDATGTSVYNTASMTTTNDVLGTIVHIRRESATSVQKLGTGAASTYAGTSTVNYASATTVSNLDSNVMYLNVTGQTDNAATACALEDLQVDWVAF